MIDNKDVLLLLLVVLLLLLYYVIIISVGKSPFSYKQTPDVGSQGTIITTNS